MAITIRAKRKQINKLLSRKEILLEVFHEGRANVPHKELLEKIAEKFKVDQKNVVLHGFRTSFGGSRTTGFVLIYDNPQYLLKYEPNFRLRRTGVLPKRNPKRKAEKELKKKIKKTRSGERRKVLAQRKSETRADVRKAKEEYIKKLIS